MAVTIRDYHDVDGNPIQPYYAAYMIEHSYERHTPPNYKFMEWIQERWAEADCGGHGQRDHAKFLVWLEDRVAA